MEEIDFIQHLTNTCYHGVYPYRIFPDKGLTRLDFAPVTILCGGNGCGKTTLLNVIAEITGVTRHSPFSGGPFFAGYVAGCQAQYKRAPEGGQILLSDDVAQYLLDMRCLMSGIDARRQELFSEYAARAGNITISSMADYDRWLADCEVRRKSKSAFVKSRLMQVDMGSGGETAMQFFAERIDRDALYLIDEPENSLSPEKQLELMEFLTLSAKYSGCQFVIATHSPLMLSLPGARIWDLDEYPASVKPWTALSHVRTYYRFFKEHAAEMEAETE